MGLAQDGILRGDRSPVPWGGGAGPADQGEGRALPPPSRGCGGLLRPAPPDGRPGVPGVRLVFDCWFLVGLLVIPPCYYGRLLFICHTPPKGGVHFSPFFLFFLAVIVNRQRILHSESVKSRDDRKAPPRPRTTWRGVLQGSKWADRSRAHF